MIDMLKMKKWFTGNNSLAVLLSLGSFFKHKEIKSLNSGDQFLGLDNFGGSFV